MSQQVSNRGIPNSNNEFQSRPVEEQKNSNTTIGSLPSLLLARIFAFASNDQIGFKTTGSIRETCREFRRINDEILLPQLGCNIREFFSNHPFFQSIPQFQCIIKANPNQMKSLTLFIELSSAIHSPCLLLPEQYLKSYQQLEDDSLVKVWERIVQSIDFQDEAVPSRPQEIRDWINNPANAMRIQAITQLDLPFMNLQLVPQEIGAFVNLQRLVLSNNLLTSLPETIGNLQQLRTLHIENNQLTSLPETFGNFQQMEFLFLNNNRLESLPKTFGNLHQLETLVLSNNRLESLPKTFWNLLQLQRLSLDNNRLESLPETIGNLQQLRNLNLSNNLLESLPETIENLQQWLRQLDLSNNFLESLPETIGNLHQLQFLSLNNNHLKSLPKTIENLHSLIRLSLDDSLCLFMLDKEFSKSTRLEALKKYRACKQYTPTTSLAKLCQIIHNQKDKDLLEQTLCSVPRTMQAKIRSRIEDIWVSLPEHQQVQNKELLRASAVRAVCHDRGEILNQAIIEILKETFSAVTPQQKDLIYDQVWELAGRPQGNDNWGGGPRRGQYHPLN